MGATGAPRAWENEVDVTTKKKSSVLVPSRLPRGVGGGNLGRGGDWRRGRSLGSLSRLFSQITTSNPSSGGQGFASCPLSLDGAKAKKRHTHLVTSKRKKSRPGEEIKKWTALP